MRRSEQGVMIQMIRVTVNGRRAALASDDLITAGSVGIQAQFTLSSDFDGLACVAVFEGSGTSRDVMITDNACEVPHEVLARAGGCLRVGVYGRNGEGTIVIPTIWACSRMIQAGAEPSGIDPAAPTPDWTAQVQETAQYAEKVAEYAAANCAEGMVIPFDPDSADAITGRYVEDADPIPGEQGWMVRATMRSCSGIDGTGKSSFSRY